MSFATLLSVLAIAMSVVALVMALSLGRRAERLGAGIFMAGGLLTIVAQAVYTEKLPYFAFLTIDLSMAIALGALALKFPDKLWPGAAAVAQSMLIVFSATRALGFPLSEAAYTAALNLSALGGSLSLAAGVVAERWGRRPELQAALPA